MAKMASTGRRSAVSYSLLDAVMEVVTSPFGTIPDAARSETMHRGSNATAENEATDISRHAILRDSTCSLRTAGGRSAGPAAARDSRTGRTASGKKPWRDQEGQASMQPGRCPDSQQAAVPKAAAIDLPPWAVTG